MANQTTMLSSESMAIADRVRDAMRARYGEAELPARFRSFDTICSATQERQDAVKALLADPPQLMIVIGGFNSSNTGHLTEMCAERVPTFHIEDAGHIESGERIFHLPVGVRTPVFDDGMVARRRDRDRDHCRGVDPGPRDRAGDRAAPADPRDPGRRPGLSREL